MVNLTNAMKNLQESKQEESNKLKELIEKQNMKKERKTLKEEYEGNYDPAALNDDIELLEKVSTTLNEIWDITKAGDSEFFLSHESELAEICDIIEKMLDEARGIFNKEHNDMLSDEEIED